MNEALKKVIETVLPPSAVQALKASRANLKQRSAKAAFDTPGPSNSFLPSSQIELLQSRYPLAIPYQYDPAALLQRGVERKREIERFVSTKAKKTLELAGGDAMVSGVLARDGAVATAIDLSTNHVDPRAIAFGAKALAADAEKLPFGDGSFDVVFSYNAFEHFPNPEIVLKEALRVLGPDGIAYFSFGPLYRSSYGLHAMHSITVPFCHYLWSRDDMDAYISKAGMGRIEYETLNEWTIDQFRSLWDRWAPYAAKTLYREVPSIHGTDLVNKHAECFRGKVDKFEDLTVAVIQIALKRTSKPFSQSVQ
ncbi:MAG: class I SAM-dependent methyltransferase [Bradyrhizobium sp.]|uniref:class I SAM-dependent methyltransferase n=1 Tax=Bradyrhizobium sp. TaxID=376 RepID=UPI001C28437D|nr:class I SAM-dependent methyltransferase [Bradyrhizobium sp.]MBU6461128.1 methyltransferase domain-containing protein [Pseudomonadota bacterium]MDE2066204.1 class I SAM-dependent methyltransferase [Bradyrhizobium sp.]MDE2472644.1 class I SAM-dependent methyltransferase [Bradyrhizobium sp.]